MKLKNILLSGLSLVLVAALAIGGTVAYLQDDDSDVNVMTLGNVSIEQHEYERVVNADGTFATATIDDRTSYVLKDFTQAKPLLPSAVIVSSTNYDTIPVRLSQVNTYGGADVFVSETNAQDKFVTVENTGKTDAYVRTIVAFEVGTADSDLFSFGYHFTWAENKIGVATIDGNQYYVVEFIYKGWNAGGRHTNGVLPAGETSYTSLCQVYLSHETTNEDVEALDGNGNGTFDILVVSQAIQAAGFADAETALNAAFGDITTTNHPWSDEDPVIPAVVEDAKDLDAALNAGDDVILNANLSFSSSDTTANSGYGATGVSVKGSTLDGAGHSLGINNWGTWDAAVHTTGGTIKNLTINSGMRGIFMGSATEDVYIDNVVIDGTVYTFNSDGGNKNYGVYISNSTLNGWTSHSDVHKEVVYTNCIFGEGSGYAYCRPYGPTTFVGCDFEAGFTVEPVGAVTFENCTIDGVPLTDANIGELVTNTANVTVK